MTFRMPRTDEHTSIIGRNGSGKTQGGAWILSTRPLETMPFVIVDYKGDELLNSVERSRDIGYRDVPDAPGLYILHAHPNDVAQMEDWMTRVWERGNTGVFFDEGYMVPDHGGLSGLLTQGRSLNIPVIMLTQRPSYVNRFVFTEASHVMVFSLNDRRDQKIIAEFTPPGFLDLTAPEFGSQARLPKYHSRWYNIKDDEAFVLRPVPDGRTIVETINAKLEPKKRWV